MTILLNRRLNGRPYLLALPSAVAATDDTGIATGTLGVGGGGSSSTTSSMSQIFSMSNWGSGASLGNFKRGVWFKRGDMPAGQIPAVSGGSAQLYAPIYWKDGSLKTARLLMRDAIIASGASRTYTMTAIPGALPVGTSAVIGNSGLVTALTGHTVRVSFANVQTWDCSTATGNFTSLGSGAFTASLATHAAVATRWTLLTTGPVADVWQGWGMATDNTSGVADPHLKVNWYVTRWKNLDGTTLALQIGAVVALDWWSVANKFFLQYDASLMDGASVLVAFPAVKHQYQSQWLICINDGGLNAGIAPWIGAAEPTLACSFDRDYAVSTGMIPPLDTSKRPTPALQYAYIPCGVVADPDSDHPNSHRAAIDATGGYNGRGVITRFDSDAFMAGTPQAYAVARLNALTGLGVPYHYRSNRFRMRPGETTSDTANTVIPLIMRPKLASFSDFTANGLPIAVDAYTANGTPDAARDGFGWQTGFCTIAGYPTYRNFSEAPGASGPWGTSIDASHAVSYCYFMALVSGDEWLLEAQIDLATNLAHQGIYGYHNFAQSFAVTWNSSTPTDYWTGLLAQFQADAIRSLGWAQLIQGHAVGLTPPDHSAYSYLQAVTSHNGDYIQTNLSHLPPDFALSAFYSPESQLGLNSLYSPWMNAFIPVCAYTHYALNEDIRWQLLGNFCASWTLRQAALQRWYSFDVYRTAHRRIRGVWNATTNPEVPVDQQVVLEMIANLDGPSSTFSINQGAYWSSTGVCPPPLSNGDQVLFTSETDGNSNGVIPVGANEGQIVYIVGLVPGSQITGRNPPTIPPTFRLAATVGGAPLSFNTAATGVNLGYFPQAASSVQIAAAGADYLSFPYIPDWGNYVPIHISVIMMARLAGNPAATQSIRDGALAFRAPMVNSTGGYYSAFDMVAP